jgi:ABC-type molybdate transport system substrate-binding protein
VKPGLSVTPATLLDTLLRDDVKLGTSTPRADPSGDYAFEVFAKAESLRAGSRTALEKKALQLTGGAASAQPPAGRSVYGWHVAEGRADIFLSYCTAATVAVRENPGQHMIALPDALAVGADYGLTVTNDASVTAHRFALFILSADGQAILAKHGFMAPSLP